MDPRKHFVTIGRDQGRRQHCAKNLTNYEAQKYSDRNVDLQRKFGVVENTPSNVLYDKLREHYI